MSLSIAIYTLGCKVNQCDAEALIALLNERGYNAFHTREFEQPADVYVINTCTVTHVSDKKSRQMVSRARKLNPNAFVAVCGCMTKTSEVTEYAFDARSPDDFLLELSKITPANKNITQKKAKTRAFIKIQDGCERFCSYCIVPYARGAVKSRPVAEIVSQARDLIRTGTLEIVLTGIQIASYGHDTENSLPYLIKEIAALDGLGRLRLSSIDPWAVSGEFLDAVSRPAVCEHFHLSLQSGCDTTLKKMNRRYSAADYARAVNALRKIHPNVTLTTDVIVGFPGESEADFLQSCDFVREMKFAKAHVFEFSPRKGTPAAEFGGQVEHKIKAERGRAMRGISDELQAEFLESQVGKTLSVLFEKENAGHSRNYCEVRAVGSKNTIKEVKIIGFEQNYLKGNGE